MSIRSRILLFALLATLIPSMGLGWVYLNQAERTLRANANQELGSQASHAERELQLWLRERYHELRVIASSLLIGSELARVNQGEEGALPRGRMRAYLELVREQYPLYSAFVIYDAQGKPLLGEPAGEEVWRLPADWRHRLERQRMVTDDDGAGSGESRMLMAVAVPDGQGLLGAVVAQPVLDALLASFADQRLPLAAQPTLLLIDRQGRVLAGHGVGAMGRRLVTLAGQLFRAPGDLAEYHNVLGRDVLARLVEVEGRPWGLVVEMDRNALYGPMERARNIAVGLVLALAAIMGFFAWTMARSILAPVAELTRAAQRIAEGDLDVSVRVRRPDELGFAMLVFNDMVMQLRQGRERLETLSTTDPLTGLLNRKGIMDGFDAFLTRYRRHRRPFSVLMLDIDHFKRINDRFGHPAGDRVLCEVGKLLRNEMRQVDLVGRYGGEEFLILLDETTEEAAYAVAERIRRLIAEAPVYHQGVPIHLTASFGAAEVAHGSEPMEALLQRVDQALYRAKRMGRNRTVLATGMPQMPRLVVDESQRA